jgi:hypothetical protein
MSTTSKSPKDTQTSSFGGDAAAESGRAGAGAAGGIPPTATSTEKAVREIVDRSAEIPAKTQGATADIIRELTRRTAEQAEESLRLSLQAAAGAQVPIVDAGYERGRTVLDTAMRVAAVHHGAAQRTADDVKDLTGSFYALARGPQAFQKVCLDLAGRSMTELTNTQRDLSWARSPVAFAEMQRDFYTGMVDRWFSGYAEWLRIGAEVAQDGLRPLRERSSAR